MSHQLKTIKNFGVNVKMTACVKSLNFMLKGVFNEEINYNIRN